jgi:hypothetical protein
MFYDSTWSTDVSKKPTLASYILKKAVVYSSETSVITYEIRHFRNSKEHNTRLRGPENNKLQTALILNAFMSME